VAAKEKSQSQVLPTARREQRQDEQDPCSQTTSYHMYRTVKNCNVIRRHGDKGLDNNTNKRSIPWSNMEDRLEGSEIKIVIT
jgi:hypothetical protein